MRILMLFALLSGAGVQAASIPGSLSQTDLANLTRFLAMGGSVRILRSAEGYPTWPGIKVGVEITFIPGGSISGLGDQLGTVSSFLPVPRLYIAKGLMEGLEGIFSFFPANLNTVAGIGGMLKWNFIRESEKWVSVAGIAGISGTNGFQGEFKGTSLEVGAMISKDYVRMRPYAGGSLMFSRGTVLPALANGSNETGTLLGTHFFLGAEWELPFNLTGQIDLYNASPSFTLFVGKRW